MTSSASVEFDGIGTLANQAGHAEPPVVVNELVKRYPKAPVAAVGGVSFTVAAGEVFGLLGPNGAGKTTTIGMLTTRIRPNSGRASVGGVDVFGDPVAARGQLAVVPQRSNLDRSLSIRDNLVFHAAYHGVPAEERGRRADEVLAQFGLLDRAKDKPDFFSGGQSQRVMIARALMHSPRVLFLDEPTTGLDPAARLFVWDRLRELKARGVAVMLTTHSMEEAAALADRVGIMDHGKILALDTPASLVRSLPGSTTIDLVTETDASDRGAEEHVDDDRAGAAAAIEGRRKSALVDDLDALPGVERAEVVAGEGGDAADRWRLRLYVAGDAPTLVAPAADVVARHALRLTDVAIGISTLEDVFIHLTGRSLR